MENLEIDINITRYTDNYAEKYVSEYNISYKWSVL